MKKITPFLLLLLIAGCGTKDTTVSQSTTSNSESPSAEVTASTGAASASQEMTSADVDKLPDSIKHEAFEYYGFSGLKVVDYEMKVGEQTATGAAIFHLKSVDGDRAVIDIEYTGGLGDELGTVTYAAVPGGLDVLGMSKGELGVDSVREIPANPRKGDTWKSKFSLTSLGRELKSDLTYTVMGVEKLKTKAGEFDALRVDFSGNLTLDGNTSPINAKTWFVKGVGMVKSEVRTKLDSGEVVRIIEATKVS